MQPPPRTAPTRIISIAAGALLSIAGLGLALLGCLLLLGHQLYERDGFLVAPSERLATTTAALVSEPMELSGLRDLPGGTGEIRLRILAGDSGRPHFVGIARADRVEQALATVAHARVTNFSSWSSEGTSYENASGSAAAGPPAELVDWEEQSSGEGTQQLTWTPRDGRWLVVAMNADGSPNVALDISVGARLPFLATLAWVLIVVGLILGAIAALIIAFGSRAHQQPVGASPPLIARVAHHRGLATQPVRVSATVTEQPSRWLWLVKWLLLFPHYVVLTALAVAFGVTTVIAWFAIVFTGRYPRALFDFNVGVLRWSWRVTGYSYGALATDAYPPFTLEHRSDYPVQLQIAYPEHLSRLLPLVKWLLVLPHLLLIAAATGGVVLAGAQQDQSALGLVGVLVLVLAGGLVFTGRLPGGVFDLLVGLHRWAYRTIAYVALLTDEYPPFRLDQGGQEPAPLPDLAGGGVAPDAPALGPPTPTPTFQ